MKNNWHKDPYLYDDVPVLKNIPGVKTSEELKRIEAGQNINEDLLTIIEQINKTLYGFKEE